MIPRAYQEELSDLGAKILKEHMIVYLAWEERTGKSLTGIRIAEKVAVSNVLIITKKNPKEDWLDLVEIDYKSTRNITVTTYGQAKKLNPKDYDLIILDEAHNYISSYPKPSTTWKQIQKLCKDKPIIYMSATPHAQGYSLLYHQFALSTWSPWWKESNFYNWHKHYGIPYQIEVHGKDVNKYDKVNEELVKTCIDHLFITKTRKELGFPYEPKDKLHWIELKPKTKERYNTLLTDKVLTDVPQMIIADSVMKLRTSLHMLEGGVMKVTLNKPPENTPIKVVLEKIKDATLYHCYYLLSNREKIDYIKETWGDTKELVIMYNFIPEGIKLRKAFKKAKVLQATSYAEGIDLTHIKHLVIYSQDYSTARHTQRRARQAGMSRDLGIDVNFLLVKKAVSNQVYTIVGKNKLNYVDSRFTKEKI